MPFPGKAMQSHVMAKATLLWAHCKYTESESEYENLKTLSLAKAAFKMQMKCVFVFGPVAHVHQMLAIYVILVSTTHPGAK